jgi:hypothetical protein
MSSDAHARSGEVNSLLRIFLLVVRYHLTQIFTNGWLIIQDTQIYVRRIWSVEKCNLAYPAKLSTGT